MKTLTLTAAFLALSPLAVAAEPPRPQPLLAHVEIARGKTTTEQAVFLSSEGEIDETLPTSSTKVRLRVLRAADGTTDLAFDLSHVGAEHVSWSARGEIAQPPPGKRVLIARVAEPSGPVEVYLSVAPYSR